MEKILELSGSDFVHLKENLLDEYEFLTRYRDLMRLDQDDIAHCLMVLGDGYEDGILIEAEGASYARYAAFLPLVRAAVEAQEELPIERYEAAMEEGMILGGLK